MLPDGSVVKCQTGRGPRIKEFSATVNAWRPFQQKSRPYSPKLTTHNLNIEIKEITSCRSIESISCFWPLHFFADFQVEHTINVSQLKYMMTTSFAEGGNNDESDQTLRWLWLKEATMTRVTKPWDDAVAFLMQRGFTPLQPPFFVRQEVMDECTQLAQVHEELYKVRTTLKCSI